jgi:chemotaxis protein methyltransferase CheR
MTTATLTIPPSAPGDSAFEFVRKLVHERSAIALEATKEYLVESRLLPVARQHGLASLNDLVATIRGKPFGPLHAQIVEAMTTNETSFFRDIHPFEALKSNVLPPLIAQRSQARALTIWSAACSTGQEPYTIAMLLAEHFPQLAGWNVQIFASDLSQQVLDRAAAGEFSQLEVNRGLPAAMLVKYFEKQGLQWRVKAEIRRRVRFVRANLIENWPPMPALDLVFLRNVLIYFTADTKRQILAKMRKHLAPWGELFLGGAETTLGIDDAWERVCHGKASTYRLATHGSAGA